jgi:hypothetical protein
MRAHLTRAAIFLLAFAASAHAQTAAPPSAVSAAECREYAVKLEACTPYACTFTHPMTGARLERKILGFTGADCATVEAMPGNHKMQCEFPADVRKAVAVFFRETQGAAAGGKTIAGRTATDAHGKAESTTTIGGKPVVNPLQQALERGLCKVGG